MSAAAVDLYPDKVKCPACLGRDDAFCWNCWGYGEVVAGSDDATCVHDYQHHETVGRCLNTYRCSKCGKDRTVDSSG